MCVEDPFSQIRSHMYYIYIICTFTDKIFKVHLLLLLLLLVLLLFINWYKEDKVL